MNIVTDVVLPIALAFIMFSLGLGLSISDFARILIKPKEFFVGFISQLIILPLIALILVFIDLMKELPITLILRPFNFDTLATQTYEFAIEEMIPLSSIYSSVIILICCILLVFLKIFLDKSDVFRS